MKEIVRSTDGFEIPDTLTERAARKIYEDDDMREEEITGRPKLPWEELPEHDRDDYRGYATSVFKVMRSEMS